MKTIIVEDDIICRNTIKELCNSRNLNFIADASTFVDAVQQIKKHKPDLVILNTRLPDNSGFSLYEFFDTPLSFSVIFISRDSGLALKAIQNQAVDFLLKPLDASALMSAIDKALGRYKIIEGKEKQEQRKKFFYQNPIGKIGLPTNDGMSYEYFENILRCEAQGSYTLVFLLDKSKVLITRTLKRFEETLQNKGFIRIHKSHLINLSHVRKYHKSKPQIVEMADGTQLEVSALRRIYLEKELNIQ